MALAAAKERRLRTDGAETVVTPERLRQRTWIEAVPHTIHADEAGRPAPAPYRLVSTRLQIMERRGSITRLGMRQAGEDFRRRRFAQAQLDFPTTGDRSHRASRMGDRNARRDREAPGLRIEAARETVWRAIQAVGGIASPAGSCLWRVLGWERSLKEWALEQGVERAAGVQPGGGVGDPGCRARGAGDAFPASLKLSI